MSKSLKMKLKAGALIGAVALSAIVGRGQASADYTTSFTTSITYQNVGDATANVQFEIYSSTGTSVGSVTRTLAAGGADSLFVGGITTLGSNFTGAATMSSDQPLVATLVQLPAAGGSVTNRPLSNGFADGSSRVLIATVLKATFGASTKFSIQNIDSSPANISIKFYNTSNVLVHTLAANNVPANSAYYVGAADVAALGATFNGSVIADSVRVGGGDGKIVGTALELDVVGPRATAFEGVQSGSKIVYMATALCSAFGGTTTNYAVQNAGAVVTDVKVTYSNGNTETKLALGPGAKVSINGCAAGNAANFSGAATIEALNAAGLLVVVGKASGPGVLATAFVGAASGTDTLAHPYIRWSTTRFDLGDRTRQRGNIAIQNIGAASVSNVLVKYYDKDGVLVGTHTIPSIAAGAKINSNPTNAILTPGYAGGTTLAEFGYYGVTSATGGGAVIEGPAGSTIISIVRISSAPASGTVSEDYSGQPIQ